eukprot:SAG25_NODE_7969_length_448_cov_0.733524_1_plen_63_part_10
MFASAALVCTKSPSHYTYMCRAHHATLCDWICHCVNSTQHVVSGRPAYTHYDSARHNSLMWVR